jgi:p-aminobenzoyl-glutamate transporter AbgT
MAIISALVITALLIDDNFMITREGVSPDESRNNVHNFNLFAAIVAVISFLFKLPGVEKGFGELCGT